MNFYSLWFYIEYLHCLVLEQHYTQFLIKVSTIQSFYCGTLWSPQSTALMVRQRVDLILNHSFRINFWWFNFKSYGNKGINYTFPLWKSQYLQSVRHNFFRRQCNLFSDQVLFPTGRHQSPITWQAGQRKEANNSASHGADVRGPNSRYLSKSKFYPFVSPFSSHMLPSTDIEK